MKARYLARNFGQPEQRVLPCLPVMAAPARVSVGLPTAAYGARADRGALAGVLRTDWRLGAGKPRDHARDPRRDRGATGRSRNLGVEVKRVHVPDPLIVHQLEGQWVSTVRMLASTNVDSAATVVRDGIFQACT